MALKRQTRLNQYGMGAVEDFPRLQGLIGDLTRRIGQQIDRN
jgi:hypothetical protein